MGAHKDVKIQVSGAAPASASPRCKARPRISADASRPGQGGGNRQVPGGVWRPASHRIQGGARRPLRLCEPGEYPDRTDRGPGRQYLHRKIKNWKEVGGPDAPITVYSRENSSGTYEFFKEHVPEGKDFVASAQTMPGTAAIVQAVVKTRMPSATGGAAYRRQQQAAQYQEGRQLAGHRPDRGQRGQRHLPIWRHLYCM